MNSYVAVSLGTDREGTGEATTHHIVVYLDIDVSSLNEPPHLTVVETVMRGILRCVFGRICCQKLVQIC